MKKRLTLLFLLGITLFASAKYRPTCSVTPGDTTKVIFNRLSFSIPEKAFPADTFFSISCDAANGLEVINFSSGARMVIHYWRPSSALQILNSNTDQCANDNDCKIIEFDSIPIKDYGSRYAYYRNPSYNRKNLTIWDAEFNMIYVIRIDSYKSSLVEDPYPKFREIIKSVSFLRD